MSTRVHLLRLRRRAESDARFQTMLVRLEADWRDQLKIKNPAHPNREAGQYEHCKIERKGVLYDK